MQQPLCKNCGLRHPLGQCKGDGTSVKPVGVTVGPSPIRSTLMRSSIVVPMPPGATVPITARQSMNNELRAILARDGLEALGAALREALADTDAKVMVTSRAAHRAISAAGMKAKRALAT